MLIVNDNTHQDTTNPTLDHFQPFDLDAWYLYSFITFTHKNLYRPNSSLSDIVYVQVGTKALSGFDKWSMTLGAPYGP